MTYTPAELLPLGALKASNDHYTPKPYDSIIGYTSMSAGKSTLIAARRVWAAKNAAESCRLDALRLRPPSARLPQALPVLADSSPTKRKRSGSAVALRPRTNLKETRSMPQLLSPLGGAPVPRDRELARPRALRATQGRASSAGLVGPHQMLEGLRAKLGAESTGLRHLASHGNIMMTNHWGGEVEDGADVLVDVAKECLRGSASARLLNGAEDDVADANDADALAGNETLDDHMDTADADAGLASGEEHSSITAATTLQAGHRSHAVRVHGHAHAAAATTLQARHRGHATRLQGQAQAKAATTMQARHRGRAARGLRRWASPQAEDQSVSQLLPRRAPLNESLQVGPGPASPAAVTGPGEDTQQAMAATKMQAHHRGHATRAEGQKQSGAATTVQASYRGHAARAQVSPMHASAALQSSPMHASAALQRLSMHGGEELAAAPHVVEAAAEQAAAEPAAAEQAAPEVAAPEVAAGEVAGAEVVAPEVAAAELAAAEVAAAEVAVAEPAAAEPAAAEQAAAEPAAVEVAAVEVAAAEPAAAEVAAAEQAAAEPAAAEPAAAEVTAAEPAAAEVAAAEPAAAEVAAAEPAAAKVASEDTVAAMLDAEPKINWKEKDEKAVLEEMREREETRIARQAQAKAAENEAIQAALTAAAERRAAKAAAQVEAKAEEARRIRAIVAAKQGGQVWANGTGALLKAADGDALASGSRD